MFIVYSNNYRARYLFINHNWQWNYNIVNVKVYILILIVQTMTHAVIIRQMKRKPVVLERIILRKIVYGPVKFTPIAMGGGDKRKWPTRFSRTPAEHIWRRYIVEDYNERDTHAVPTGTLATYRIRKESSGKGTSHEMGGTVWWKYG